MFAPFLILAALHFTPLPPMATLPPLRFAPLVPVVEPESRRCTNVERLLCGDACGVISQTVSTCSVGTDPVSRKMTLSCGCINQATRA